MTAPTGEPTPAPTPAPAPPAPTPAPAPAPSPAAALPADWNGKIEDLPKKVQDIITEARAEAGKVRTSAKEQAAAEAREELLKKLGLTKDGDPIADPEKLAAQLASKDAQLLQLQRESAAGTAARLAGADVDAMLDSRKFVTALGDLDPASKDFGDKVKTLVETTVKENPKFKATQAAAANGVSTTGGPGEHADIDAQIEAATKAGNHALAISLKRQKAYAPRV